MGPTCGHQFNARGEAPSWSEPRLYDVDGLIVLQQPLDIIELELRAKALTEALAQFLQDSPCALHVDLTRHLDRGVIAVVAAPQRPAERIGVLVGARLSGAARIAGPRPLPHLLL